MGGGGVRLQADVDALGNVAVDVPPALLSGFLGHPHERVDDLLVRHSVDRAQIAYVAGVDGAAAVLQVTDLGLGDHEPLGCFCALQPACLTEPAELGSQAASSDGGIAVRRHGGVPPVPSRCAGPQVAMEQGLLIMCHAVVFVGQPKRTVTSSCASPREPPGALSGGDRKTGTSACFTCRRRLLNPLSWRQMPV